MEAKRQRISDLIHAGTSRKEIVRIVGCSPGIITEVKRLEKDGKGLGRKPGSGGKNKILNEGFLEVMADKIKDIPSTSMHSMFKELSVYRQTVRNAASLLICAST